MVSSKNVCAATKSKENEKEMSPSPQPFQEPDGLTSVDLNSGDYVQNNSLDIKPMKSYKFKYWTYLLYIFTIMGLGLISLLFVVLLNTEHVFFGKIPLKNIYENNTIVNEGPLIWDKPENNDYEIRETFAYEFEPENPFIQKLISGNYLEDSKGKLKLCEIWKTYEDCCEIFLYSDLFELLQFCQVDDVLEIITEYKKNRIRKRDIPSYDYDYNQPSNIYYDASNPENDYNTYMEPVNYYGEPNQPEQYLQNYDTNLLENQQILNDNSRNSRDEIPKQVLLASEDTKNYFSDPNTPPDNYRLFQQEFQPEYVEHDHEEQIYEHQNQQPNRKMIENSINHPNQRKLVQTTPEIETSPHQTHDERKPVQIHDVKLINNLQNIPVPKTLDHDLRITSNYDNLPKTAIPPFKNHQQMKINQQELIHPLQNQNKHEQIRTDDVKMINNPETLQFPKKLDHDIRATTEDGRINKINTALDEKPTNQHPNQKIQKPINSQDVKLINNSNTTPETEVISTTQSTSIEKTTILPADPEETFPFETDTSLELAGIKGDNRTLQIELKNTDIDIMRTENPQGERTKLTDMLEDESSEESTEEPRDKTSQDVQKSVFRSHRRTPSTVKPDEEDLTQTRTSTRENQQDGDFRSKTKTFATSEDVQVHQQTIMNPCFYSYPYQAIPYPPPYAPTPYKLGSPYDGSHLLKIMPVNAQPRQQYVLNPPMYYGSSQAAPPYIPQYAPPIPPQQSYNNPVQVSGPGGQYYVCNPVPPPSTGSSNLAGTPGVEIRREATNLQDLLEDKYPEKNAINNRSRESTPSMLECPIGEISCADNTKCISLHHMCDSEIHCDDASDELMCDCKDRMGKFRRCDGYCDCPDCSDETGCFGCKEDEFSCDDWSRFRKSTCIPIQNRCDNIRHCEVTGKDEEDCSVLVDHIGNLPLNKISNSVGFLHRNYKGKWYPTCFGTDLWAVEVCQVEAGPSTKDPRSHMMINTDSYNGNFINILPNNDVSLVNTCVQDRAAFVECPPIFCGLRMVTKNPYRPEEVDTSIEDILNDLERTNRGDILSATQEVVHNTTDILGVSRVVGGKASQPAAWPWLVSVYRNGIFHCGGVLIDEFWIITAAHCVDRFWQYYYEIQAGVLRRFSYAPMEQSRFAVRAIAHEHYNKADLSNDIALIRLSAPMRYNRYVRPICLPSEATAGRDFMIGPPAGTLCTTVGWGATAEHGADPDHMREVELPVIEKCKRKEDQHIEEICAGLTEGGKDACQGDSGGPFMCRNPNNPAQWYLAGIVSHGEGCARPNEPGVYTRVSRYLDWISENMQNQKFISRLPLQKCPGYICKATNRCLPKKRRCDRIVDCLMGDDEEHCENVFHTIFKHSRKNVIVGNVLNIPQQNPEESEQRYFKCEIMLQVIPIERKCDKQLDCEDGSDEQNCTCVDYIKNINPNAICDGIVDCFDSSDEVNCDNCTSSQYYCRQSKTCIAQSKRCNNVSDCDKGEDELDCAALTDGLTLTLDVDLRPKLVTSGIITINRSGVWRPFCANSTSHGEASIATNVCNLLGFEEYSTFHKYRGRDKALSVVTEGSEKGNKTTKDEEVKGKDCDGLYVRCSNVTLDSPLRKIHRDNITDDIELYTSPWNVAIYSDGTYKCMGTILDKRWIVTSINCFKGITILQSHYVVAVMGKGKIDLNVQGPYDQIVRIAQKVEVASTDIVLLMTEEDIAFSRYVTPSNINARRDGHRIENCITVGMENGKTKYISLSPVKNCPVGYRCFEKRNKMSCTGDIPWSGTIVCDSSGAGWYPAAVYGETNGSCGFIGVKQYTSIRFYKDKLLEATKQPVVPVEPPKCEGFRCTLGHCINKNKTCDKIPDCHGAEDESSSLCYEKEMQCHLTDNCVCPRTHLKCSNNKCVPKSVFCDRKNDCENFEDEPEVCSCREYLRLTAPEKNCDGTVHCMDRSDEDPRFCNCGLKDFQCGNTTYCVSQEMVCDGNKDCPGGEDETVCLKLNEEDNHRNAGEVLSRTAGIWHPGCFSLNYNLAELEEFCEKLGFAGSSASQLVLPHNSTNGQFSAANLTSLRPVMDPFEVVWLRRKSGNRMKIRIRSGNAPYVTFLPDTECFRLFIACM